MFWILLNWIESITIRHQIKVAQWSYCNNKGVISNIPVYYIKMASASSSMNNSFETSSKKISRIVLKNIPDYANELRLKEWVAEFGVITDCKLLRNKNGVSRQIAFIGFKKPDSAERCVARKHQTFFFFFFPLIMLDDNIFMFDDWKNQIQGIFLNWKNQHFFFRAFFFKHFFF